MVEITDRFVFRVAMFLAGAAVLTFISGCDELKKESSALLEHGQVAPDQEAPEQAALRQRVFELEVNVQRLADLARAQGEKMASMDEALKSHAGAILMKHPDLDPKRRQVAPGADLPERAETVPESTSSGTSEQVGGAR